MHVIRRASRIATGDPAAAVNSAGQRRILIVDDDVDMRHSLRLVLAAVGYEVEVAADGSQAIHKQRAHPADLVVTDLFMPITDGIETIRQLRSEFPEAKIVAMSGGGASMPGERYLSAARAAGADAILSKPFAAGQIEECLQRLLDGP